MDRTEDRGLPENWSEHVAPTGHLYYYNSSTGESTYKKPKPVRKTFKKQKTAVPLKAMYKYQLEGFEWLIVFTNEGTHFFHNTKTLKSHWRVEDENLRKAVDALNKRDLLLLIAKSRGLKIDEEVERGLRNQSYSELVTNANEHIENDTTGTSEAVIPESTDDDSSSEEEDGLNIAELEGFLSDDNDDNENNPDTVDDYSANKLKFVQLLEDSNLDCFGNWDTESLKIVTDPRFLVIDGNKERKAIFDEWSANSIKLQDSQKKEESKDLESEYHEDQPFVKFMKLVENSKQPDKLYLDFRKKNKKKLLKIDMSDREKERTYKEYYVLIQKNLEERIFLFKSLLLNSKIFKRNLQNSSAEILNENDPILETMERKACYEYLRKIETQLQLSESLLFNVKYYVIDVNLRIKLILELARLLKVQ